MGGFGRDGVLGCELRSGLEVVPTRRDKVRDKLVASGHGHVLEAG